jgi:hypothetical protein
MSLTEGSTVGAETIKVPKRVFIIPYRNRVPQKFFFCKYMSFLLEDRDDYEIYFSHQCDARSFNRGATKNIGFLAIKEKYPNDYKNITFIFNDIDTIPFHKMFDYTTTHGIVKHYYGFMYALGGIVALTGRDFELINGYPNFWGWGMEDNVLQKRCNRFQLRIDRSNFYPIGSHEMLQLFDGVTRIISKKDPWRASHDTGQDGIRSINNLAYTIDVDSVYPKDNVYQIPLDEKISSKTFYINISSFMTGVRFENDEYSSYDLREPPRKIINPTIFTKGPEPNNAQKQVQQLQADNWTNIPYYPDFAEKKEEKKLLQEELELQQELQCRMQMPEQRYLQSQVNYQQSAFVQRPVSATNASISATTKYSPDYARSINVKPRASKSANIGLGGVR